MSRATMHTAIPILASLDISATVRFYTGTLGFTCRLEVPGEYAIIERDAIEIHFWACAEAHVAENTACRIRVTDIAMLYEEYALRKALRADSRVESKPWGTREFEVFDPDGNLITFVERTAKTA